MIKKTLLVTLIFLLMIAVPASAEITYTSDTKTECYDDSRRCYTTLYSGTMFAQDSRGEWVDPYEVLSMTKNQDDITFHYDGIDGQYSITFEAGVIYNGNYISFSEVKQNNPEIEFSFPTTQTSMGYKYAVNITNLDGLNMALIENITLTYRGHEGFQLSSLKKSKKGFNIKQTMGIYFDDLIELHPLTININEKRIYISNITDNIVNGQLYLDPQLILQDPNTENLEDAGVTSGVSANFNSGSATESELGEVGSSRFKFIYTKFNIDLIPDNVNILTSELNYYIVNDESFSGSVFTYGVTNQTWKEGTLGFGDCTNPAACNGGIKFNGKPTINTDILDTVVDPNINELLMLNVTTFTINQYDASNNNVTFYVNTSGVASEQRIIVAMKENANTTIRPFLNISYLSAINFGINISVFSAVDGETPITSWGVAFENATQASSSVGNNNPTLFNTSDIEIGASVNVTIFKDGYVNATYDVPIDGSHLENLTSFIFTVARGLINIEDPTNSTTTAGLSFDINITSPGSITGDLNSIFYELNGSSNWISLCTGCSGFAGSINLGGFGTQDLIMRAASTVYGHNFAQSQFTNLFAVYDILIMDELRNITFNFDELVDFANLTAFCPDTELEFDITSNSTPTVNIGCEFNYLQLDMKLKNQTESHFRTLIPDFDVNTVTFHMIDNITLDPEDNFIDVKLTLDDLTGNFRNGIVHIKKALNGSIVDIIDQRVDAESSILAYLVIGERYILSIESSDGSETKQLGTLFIRDSTESNKRLRISDLGVFPELQDFVNWEFTSNFTEGFINFTYNDTLSQTSSITFSIYNTTNPANLVLLFSNTSINNPNVFFTWPNGELGNTYLARFTATHISFGEIRQDVVFIFSERLFPLSIFEGDTRWYTIAALIVIMMTSLLFGARAAAFGVVVVVIEAAFFTIIGWLDITNPGVLVSLISLMMLLAVMSWIGLRRREQ